MSLVHADQFGIYVWLYGGSVRFHVFSAVGGGLEQLFSRVVAEPVSEFGFRGCPLDFVALIVLDVGMRWPIEF